MSSLLTFLSHESSEEALTTTTQSRTFLYWVNLSLKKKSLRINDLYSDFENGVMLIQLMECLAPDKKIPGRYAFLFISYGLTTHAHNASYMRIAHVIEQSLEEINNNFLAKA